MSDLLPPLTELQRATLARLYTGAVILSQKAWTHWKDPDGRIDFAAADPRTSIAGLAKRGLISEREPTDVEYKRGAYRVAYVISDAGRVAHEALARATRA